MLPGRDFYLSQLAREESAGQAPIAVHSVRTELQQHSGTLFSLERKKERSHLIACGGRKVLARNEARM